MLRLGNSKLGAGIYQWSIPSGDKRICVGATKACLGVCYATRNHYLRPAVKTAMQRNLAISREAQFETLMSSWVRGQVAKVVRIHASGDFFSSSYVQKWIRVIKANRRVTFFAYTRSWRSAKILEALKEAAELPNLQLWFSCDQDSGEPPVVPGVRRAYLMLNNSDVPPFQVDLVFRNRHSVPMKWVESALVCPYENGVKSRHGNKPTITCSTCKLCFRKEAVPVKEQSHVNGNTTSVTALEPAARRRRAFKHLAKLRKLAGQRSATKRRSKANFS